MKILGDGEFNKKLTVVAAWYSRSAHQKIVAAGGSAQNLKSEPFEFPKPKKKFVPREPVKKKAADDAESAPAAPAGRRSAAAPADAEKPAE